MELCSTVCYICAFWAFKYGVATGFCFVVGCFFFNWFQCIAAIFTQAQLAQNHNNNYKKTQTHRKPSNTHLYTQFYTHINKKKVRKKCIPCLCFVSFSLFLYCCNVSLYIFLCCLVSNVRSACVSLWIFPTLFCFILFVPLGRPEKKVSFIWFIFHFSRSIISTNK